MYNQHIITHKNQSFESLRKRNIIKQLIFSIVLALSVALLLFIISFFEDDVTPLYMVLASLTMGLFTATISLNDYRKYMITYSGQVTKTYVYKDRKSNQLQYTIKIRSGLRSHRTVIRETSSNSTEASQILDFYANKQVSFLPGIPYPIGSFSDEDSIYFNPIYGTVIAASKN